MGIIHCAYRILKQLTSKFASQFALLSILEARIIRDMPLIIQTIVFCHLWKRRVLLEYSLSELCAPGMESRWDTWQMCLGAARQPKKKKGKQQQKGRR